MIGNCLPVRPKYRAQRNGEETTGVVCLGAHVEDGDDHADEDESHRAIDSSRTSNIDGKANVVPARTAGVEEEDETAEESS